MVLKNEKGIALPLALMVMLVLSLLGIALWQYSITDTMHVTIDEKRMQAHYIARSGAVATADWINNNKTQAYQLIGRQSDPVQFGNGTYEVKVSGETVQYKGNTLCRWVKIESRGTVDQADSNISDNVTIVLNFTIPGELPNNPSNIFPPGFDFENGWRDGTNSTAEPQWVTINNGHIVNDTPIIENGNYVSVSFPNGIVVEHQEGQQTFNLYATYMYFKNPGLSLYVKQGNILNLYSDIIVFSGNTWLDRNTNINYGELSFHVINGEYINGGISGRKYGRVYFYNDVLYGNNTNNQNIMLPKGAYYFADGVILRGSPQIIPELLDGGLIPIGSNDSGDDSNMKWQ